MTYTNNESSALALEYLKHIYSPLKVNRLGESSAKEEAASNGETTGNLIFKGRSKREIGNGHVLPEERVSIILPLLYDHQRILQLGDALLRFGDG